MKNAILLATLPALILVSAGCMRDPQRADAALCEADRAFRTSQPLATGMRDDAGRHYFEIAFHPLPRAPRTYSFIASMSPPVEELEFPAVIEVGAEPKQFRTTASDSPLFQVGAQERSLAWFDASIDAAMFTTPVVGKYPVAGRSLVIQTAENITTHTLAAGNEQSIDIAAPRGSVVTAFKSGVVQDVEQRYHDDNSCGSAYSTTYTNHLRILQDDGYEAIYAHLEHESIIVADGQRVETGQLLARVGCFDVCTNAHLHLQVGALGNDGYQSVPVHFYLNDPASTWQPRPGETRGLEEQQAQ